MKKTYIGINIIKAEPMTMGEYIKGKWQKDKDGSMHLSVNLLNLDPETRGYLVKDSDTYISWSPKDVFEGLYRLITPEEAKLIVGDGNVFVVGKTISVEDETNE